MIARFLGTATTMIVYLAAATFIAQLIIMWHLWHTWGMNRDRAIQMYAIAMGADLFDPERVEEQILKRKSEEVMLEQVIAERAKLERDIELREQTLKSGWDTFKFEQRRLIDEQERLQRSRENFEQRMQDIQESARAQGLADLVQMLQKIKADQAKEQILIMLDRGEGEDGIDTVVQVFRMMEERARSKIMAELNNEEGNEKLAKVLEMIRDGEPEAGIADQALQGASGNNPAGAASNPGNAGPNPAP